MRKTLSFIMALFPCFLFSQINISSVQDDIETKEDFRPTDILYKFDLHDYDRMSSTDCTFRPCEYNMTGQRILVVNTTSSAWGVLKLAPDGSQVILDSLPGMKYYTIGKYMLTLEEMKQFNDSVSALKKLYTRRNTTLEEYKKIVKAQGRKLSKEDLEYEYRHLHENVIRLNGRTLEDLKNYYEMVTTNDAEQRRAYSVLEYEGVIQLLDENGSEYYVVDNMFNKYGCCFVVESFWNEYIAPLKGTKVNKQNFPDLFSSSEKEYDALHNMTYEFECVDVSVNPENKTLHDGTTIGISCQPSFMATFVGSDGKKVTAPYYYTHVIKFKGENIGLSPSGFYSELNIERYLNVISPSMDKYFAELHEKEAKDKAAYEAAEAQRKADYEVRKAARLKKLTAKYGAHYAQCIVEGKLEVGMTEAMVNEVGAYTTREPLYIGEHKEVYRYQSLVNIYTDMTFVDGKLTKYESHFNEKKRK